MSNIKTIKLQTGQEIVGRVLTNTEDKHWTEHKFLLIEDPVVPIPQENEQIRSVPFSLTGEDERLEISTQSILSVLETKKELRERFTRQMLGMLNPETQTELVDPEASAEMFREHTDPLRM